MPHKIVGPAEPVYITDIAAEVGAELTPLPIYTKDGNSVDVTILNTSIDVALQDQYTRNFAWRAKRILNSVVLSSPTVVGSRTISLVAGHGFIAGDIITLLESGIPYQGQVIISASESIIVDSPVSYVYTPGQVLSYRTSTNVNVDGSSTPVIFNCSPIGIAWDVTHLTITLIASGDMDDSMFGNIVGGLTNGLVIRKKVSDSLYYNLTGVSFKTNGDFEISGADTQYRDKAGGGGYSFHANFQFGGQDGFGTVIRLDGTKDPIEELQIIVQDNLSTLTCVQCAIIGHEVLP